ncbi:MAG: SDR family oxidoreductase [Roseococcus sp.]|nr:SDR family oxidoreductase [Roseococcus sp.]
MPKQHPDRGWSVEDIPTQAGRVALVTGGSGGLGAQVALGLLRAGARVMLAARDAEQGEKAAAAMRAAVPGAAVEYQPLDLASLASVAACAQSVAARAPAVDLLVNNAGVMALPERRETQDGFEMQWGVNHLGHVALTARLLPLLRRGHAARVVWVSSLAHRLGRLNFADLQARRGYHPWRAYAQSKLAVLAFALEFERRARAGGWGVSGLAAHPGWALTNLYANGPLAGRAPGFLVRLMRRGTRLLSHSAEVGALPILYAATAPDAQGGSFIGRSWLSELRGPPGPAKAAPAALDRRLACRLWQVSQAMAGCGFPKS